METPEHQIGSYPPWSRIPSIVEMTAEAGIDYDQFTACLKQGLSEAEMARRFGVKETTITSLTDHFWHYGVGSVIGGD
ncbi:MAG: helix-turn-helix domain-containing protein [Deltaproteobacteria bacterium]